MIERSGERIVRANGVDLCAQSFGARADPATLLIAGAASSMLHWPEELCERLAAGPRFVIRYDHRDTGRSVSYPPGAPGYDGDELDEDAIGLLDALGIARAHIVGISAGGGIGQALGVRHPERVASLTLISTSPLGAGPPDDGDPSEDDSGGLFGVPEPDWSDQAAVIDYLVAQEQACTSKTRPIEEEYLRDLANRTFDRSLSIASANNHFLAVSSGEPIARDRLAEITAPTLVIHGTEDPLFPLPHGVALANAIPGARLLALEHTGHELPPAVWDQVIPEILRHTA